MSSDDLNSDALCALDRIRLDNGIDALKSYFRKLVRFDLRKAIELVNDENLHFLTLYVLKPDITIYRITSCMGPRNRKALEIINGITSKKAAAIERMTDNRSMTVCPVLKWILLTGSADDGFNDRYDEIMDQTAALLTNYYKDNSVLRQIADMTFRRYKKGLLIHHLVWAFFEARDPNSLIHIANYMLSAEQKDNELACKLLNFIPCIYRDDGMDKIKKYYSVLNWIEENKPFLYYTGESFHQTCKPLPYAISTEAKYVCRRVVPGEDRMPGSMTEDEEKLLDGFRKLSRESRDLLSDCSYQLYRRNLYSWNIWIHYPVNEQLRTASLIMGEYA